jgi:tetratricopeptide (TPR) repeat protein
VNKLVGRRSQSPCQTFGVNKCNLAVSVNVEVQDNAGPNERGTHSAHSCQKRYGLALADYTAAIAIDPNFSLSFMNRAIIFSNLRRLDEALADLDEAARLDPTSADIFVNRGILFMRRQEPERAINAFSAAIRIRGDDAELYARRGMAMHALRRYAEAEADYERALVLDTNNRTARNGLNSLRSRR